MASSSQGLAGLDRKAMEEERLARLAKKRTADVAIEASDDLPANDKAQRIHAQSDNGNHAAPMTVDLTKSKVDTSTTSFTNEQAHSQTHNHKLAFPRGAIRKTWAFGHERKHDIKIEEVLQKKDLKTAVISSFTWDFDWLFTKFELQSTKFVLVMQARTESERLERQEDFRELSKRVKLCFPPMPGTQYTCMHSKLMLLFYPQHLRVVVPSANCVPFDWGETGMMENCVFLIDLPRLPDAQQGSSNKTLTEFSKELLRFLDAMKIQEDVRNGILNFDFIKTADIRFVHSIAGSHYGSAAKYTGFPGLSRAVSSVGMQSPSETNMEVDMAVSSVSAIDHEFLDSLYRSLHGKEPKEPLPARSKAKIAPVTRNNAKHANKFRLIFPSQETVQQSTGGPKNGGTIFLKPDYYRRPKFPSEIIRDYKSRRAGLLSHNKLIFARTATAAFMYSGSANLGYAAWGRLSHDATSKTAKLTLANWECGVLLPIRRADTDSQTPTGDAESDAESSQKASLGSNSREVLPIEVFDEVLPTPFEYPANRYEHGQLPWHAGTGLNGPE